MERMENILKKIPAGLMVLPMLLGVLVHTFCPQVLEIGSFTTAVFSRAGAATVMGVQMVCLGSRLKLKSVPGILAQSGILLMGKLALGFLCAGIFRLLGTGMIFGVSLVAVAAAVSNTNGSLYLSLTTMYGEDRAVAGTPVLALNNGPFFTMLILAASGYLPLSPIQFLAMLLPMLLGMLLGNLWKSAEEFLSSGVRLLIPFIGFSLGASMDLRDIFYAGFGGILMAGAVTVIGGSLMTCVDRWVCRGSGIAGMAASATGANAVMIPAAMATLLPEFEPYAARAAAQLAVCAIVGALLIPLLTAWTAVKSKSVNS